MPPRVRRNRNSQYTVQVEQVTRDVKNQLLIEDGALIQSEGAIYAGINNEWVQVAPITNNSLQVGWARYDDTMFTVSNPSYFTDATPFSMYNDGGVIFDPYSLSMYDADNQLFTLEAGATYALTIAFKAFLNTNNGHIELQFNATDDPDYSNIADVVIFPKGNGVEHIYSRSFNFYCNEAATTGINLIMTASHAGAIYDVKYFIEKLSHA